MSLLTLRAERALLGALVADQDPPEQLANLRASDFGGREHRALYTDIMTVRQDTPMLRGAALIDAVASHTGSADIGSYLEQLLDDCPDPEHVLTYAKLVQTSAFRREVADHAERLAAETASAPQTDGTTYTQLLGGALADHARRYAALTSVDTSGLRDAFGSPLVSPQYHQDSRAQQEDQLLADLLQNPRQAYDLATFLPAESFTDPQREEAYRTMLTLAVDGDPIDEVVVGWQMANLRAINSPSAAKTTDRPEPAVPDDVYLARLAAMRDTTSAVQIGASLIVEDLRAGSSLVPANTGQTHSPAPPVPALNSAPMDPTLQPPTTNHTGPSPRPGR